MVHWNLWWSTPRQWKWICRATHPLASLDVHSNILASLEKCMLKELWNISGQYVFCFKPYIKGYCINFGPTVNHAVIISRIGRHHMYITFFKFYRTSGRWPLLREKNRFYGLTFSFKAYRISKFSNVSLEEQ